MSLLASTCNKLKPFFQLSVVGSAILLLLALFVFYNLPTVYAKRVVLFVIYFVLLLRFRVRLQQLFVPLSYYGKVTFLLVFFGLTIKFLPGGYFPPFFSGIGGWNVTIDTTKPLKNTGLQLVRADGQTIWYSHGITSPQNFLGRQIAYCKKNKALLPVMFDYYLRLYKRHYPYLAQGQYPSQKYLGRFAYPGHNTYRMLPYKNFPPDSIVDMVLVTETYDRKTLQLLKRAVSHRYHVATQTVTRVKT